MHMPPALAQKTTALALLALLYTGGCGESAPDPRTVRGAIAAATLALEQRDSARLFRCIDQRARHAMASIVTDRKAAQALITAQYPQAERDAALQALGDAAQVATPAELFAKRCGAACMNALAAELGAPASEQPDGEEVVVTTVRGTTLHMHPGKDGYYGLVWNTRELSEERDRASRELGQITENASVYERRRTLERAAAAP